MGIHHGAGSAVTVIGDNVASASPSATGSADLVSAATNTGGIIITSVSLDLVDQTASSAHSYVELTVNGTAVMRQTVSAAAGYGWIRSD